ncbi:DUF6994 family protein [Ornithinimicrobium sediminis]|uniref:DUF6994 family protein n=1 Tax=Ornithinimicrobium sediminis TaxID=2904603 RepID=UPI001E4C95B9|nr:hypothetical protein [Ornithinimicrobium sediminis]MCE0488132.1 hypothetical protein [Ornithinimicrobium sediminis]
MLLDTSFDFRDDTPKGKDPDTHSPTLRRYHQALWSRPLPSGQMFQLTTAKRRPYLLHESDLGRFRLASDTAVPTFGKSARSIIEALPEEDVRRFRTLQYSIGGMLVWPSNRVGGKQTINGARGFRRKIADRLDLTLECVRRHYVSESSPLDDVLSRYERYFALFVDFEGYVDFFHLQDLVTNDTAEVRFHLPFDNFMTSARPTDAETYASYRHSAMEFIEARNRRIDALKIQVD